jgi:hypothetical protein
MFTYHRAPAVFELKIGPLRLERVGVLAILDLGFCHIMKVGRRFGFGWGKS